jgi:acyl-CoA thioesterase
MSDALARSVYERMMEQDYCSQWMGIEALEISEGYCKLKMTVRREMLNGFGILHGGIAFAFADSAFAFASNSYGRVAVSLHGSMSYARSAKEGEELFAEASTLHLSRKTGEFEVTITNSGGEACYFFRGTVYRKQESVL